MRTSRKLITLIAALALIFTSVVPAFAADFTDLEGHWAKTYVERLVEKGIMKVGVFNDDKFDHTYWYTFTAYGNELLDDSRCFD